MAGATTTFWGILGFIAIPDSPAITRAPYLGAAEKELSRSRMNDSGIQTSNLIPFSVVVQKLKTLAKTPITYLFLAAYLQFAWSQRANSYFLLYLKGLVNEDGSPRYSIYTVNLIPLGGYAISIVTNIGLNALSDWKGWRWQVSVGAAALQLIATGVLSGWPERWQITITFYFLTFATSAWGYALLAWLAEILRREPEVRSILVAIAITLVYIGHATIPLRAWRVSDSPRYPIGFPLAAAFSGGSIIAIMGLRLYVRRRPLILGQRLEPEPSKP